MEMADVFCKCGAPCGYKFVGDKTADGRNHNQVGRFGLVASCFAKVNPPNPPPNNPPLTSPLPPPSYAPPS